MNKSTTIDYFNNYFLHYVVIFVGNVTLNKRQEDQ